MLWAAIRATQKKYPNVMCVVYTGDQDADKATILSRVEVSSVLYTVLHRLPACPPTHTHTPLPPPAHYTPSSPAHSY